MEIVTKCGRKVKVSNDFVREDEEFVLNNPHPESSLKNVIKKCSTNDGSFITAIGDLAVRKYPVSWCKKIIKYL